MRYSYSVLGSNNPDFVKLAESYGAVGLRADTPAEMYDVLKKAMEINDKPVLMDLRVVEEENCYPMVPSGAALNEMVESDEENNNKKGRIETKPKLKKYTYR